MPTVNDDEVINEITFVVFELLEIIIHPHFVDHILHGLDVVSYGTDSQSYDVQDEEGDPDKLEKSKETFSVNSFLSTLFTKLLPPILKTKPPGTVC